VQKMLFNYLYTPLYPFIMEAAQADEYW